MSTTASKNYVIPSSNLAALRKKAEQIDGERATYRKLIAADMAEKEQAQQLATELEEALSVLQALEGSWRRSFEQALADLVSRGLTAVFGEPMTLNIENRLVRDVLSTELTLTTGKDTQEITTPVLGANGGSVVNVLSVLLRVLLTISAKPALRRVIVLDEAFSMIDEYSMPETVGQLLKELAETLGIQFVVVSHSQELTSAADVTYEVSRNGKTSKVTRI